MFQCVKWILLPEFLLLPAIFKWWFIQSVLALLWNSMRLGNKIQISRHLQCLKNLEIFSYLDMKAKNELVSPQQLTVLTKYILLVIRNVKWNHTLINLFSPSGRFCSVPGWRLWNDLSELLGGLQGVGLSGGQELGGPPVLSGQDLAARAFPRSQPGAGQPGALVQAQPWTSGTSIEMGTSQGWAGTWACRWVQLVTAHGWARQGCVGLETCPAVRKGLMAPGSWRGVLGHGHGWGRPQDAGQGHSGLVVPLVRWQYSRSLFFFWLQHRDF